MHMDCDIIRDLLPLYEDGALSESGARAVSAHLACPACRDYRARVEGDSVARAPRTAAPETMELRAVAPKYGVETSLSPCSARSCSSGPSSSPSTTPRPRQQTAAVRAAAEVVLDSDGASVSGYTMYYGLGCKVIQYQKRIQPQRLRNRHMVLQPGNIDSVTQAELDAIEAYLSEEMTLRYGDEKLFQHKNPALRADGRAHKENIPVGMHRDLPRPGSPQREHYGGKRRLHASRRHHPDGGRPNDGHRRLAPARRQLLRCGHCIGIPDLGAPAALGIRRRRPAARSEPAKPDKGAAVFRRASAALNRSAKAGGQGPCPPAACPRPHPAGGLWRAGRVPLSRKRGRYLFISGSGGAAADAWSR